MDYNFHTHTYLCHHAEGDMEEYVKRAISGGVKYMGFSEHFPLVLSNGKQSPFRMYVEDVSLYRQTVDELKEKYKGKIQLYLGFEMEYYPGNFSRMLENAKAYGAEYLIMGEHFYCPEDTPDIYHASVKTEDEERLRAYTAAVVEGIAQEIFTYVAHPDVLHFVGNEALYQSEFRKICQAAKVHKTPLEINFLGIRTGRYYPNEKLLQIMGEEGAPVTFGFDAHDAQSAYDGASLEVALSLVKKYHLHYIGKPPLRFLQ